jgi:hypothetical protein
MKINKRKSSEDPPHKGELVGKRRKIRVSVEELAGKSTGGREMVQDDCRH